MCCHLKVCYDHPISAREFVDLAASVGLQIILWVRMTVDWSYLDGLLRQYGPIWAAGDWNGFNHVVVITGAIEDGTVYVNDPAPAYPYRRTCTTLGSTSTLPKDVLAPMMYLP